MARFGRIKGTVFGLLGGLDTSVILVSKLERNVYFLTLFSFIGTEILAVTAAETKDPRRNLSSAIKKVWIRILLFYILGVFSMGLVVPSDNDRLGTASDATASPFVIAGDLVAIKVLPSIISMSSAPRCRLTSDACILSSAWSAAAADLYIASRTVYSIALNGDLPRILLKTTSRGVPWVSVALCASFGALAYMGVDQGANTVFGWLAVSPGRCLFLGT